MSILIEYNRNNAIEYAHKWAYARNPVFFNYDNFGGDCTNFVSQCILAGGGVMNYLKIFGWYYINGDEKAPAWTGVPYFYNFLTRNSQSIGPFGKECEILKVEKGDLVQLSFNGVTYAHTLIIVSVKNSINTDNILVATHTYDTDYTPLSTYNYIKLRFIKIKGIYVNN